MFSVDKIEDSIKKLQYSDVNSIRQRILQNALDELDKSEKERFDIPCASKCSMTINNRITKLAALAAAVMIIAAVIGLWPEASITNKVYGLSDVPALIRNAKTIHTKGWITRANVRGQEGQDRQYVEEWIDIEKGRFRTIGFGGIKIHPEPHAFWHKVERINDGQYQMYIDHGFEEVQFQRLNEFKQKLAVRKAVDLFLERILLSPGELTGFTQVAEENINGINFFVWEKKTIYEEQGIERKSKYWVSPSTGEMRKREGWEKGETTDGNWKMTLEKEFEIDIDIPQEVFETEPPIGYTVRNAKETASSGSLMIASPIMLDAVKGNIAIVLSLANGIGIMGWYIKSDTPIDKRMELFENLEPGDELPKSPVGITFELWPKNNIFNVTYVGRYLAQNQKNGKFFEWGIYIPDKEFDARDLSHSRKISFVHYPENESEVRDTTRFTNCQTLIVEEEEFDAFVRGAMAELSDDGVVPDYITYDKVIQLAEEIRQSN